MAESYIVGSNQAAALVAHWKTYDLDGMATSDFGHSTKEANAVVTDWPGVAGTAGMAANEMIVLDNLLQADLSSTGEALMASVDVALAINNKAIAGFGEVASMKEATNDVAASKPTFSQAIILEAVAAHMVRCYTYYYMNSAHMNNLSYCNYLCFGNMEQDLPAFDLVACCWAFNSFSTVEDVCLCP